MLLDPSHINNWIILIGSIVAGVSAAWIGLRKVVAYVRNMDGIHTQRSKFITHFGAEYADAIREIFDDLIAANDLSYAKHAIFIRRLKIGVYVCDAETGNCIYSYGLEEVFGITTDEILGLGWTTQIVERDKCIKEWKSSVERKTTYRDEYTVRNATTGALVKCRTEAFRTNGEEPRYVGYVEIISEQKNSNT